jgi:uncharacterized membrane protein YeaQ/YmgE (transglycosylase-associated protein family)
MDTRGIVVWLVTGGLAGFLASKLVMGGGLGVVWNVIVGIIGAVIAGYLLPGYMPPIGGPFVNAVITAFIGAVIILVIFRLFSAFSNR